jgi:hypothetical protein
MAGTREITCKDESAETVRATAAAMLFTRDLFLSGSYSSGLRGEETLEILRFSKRCLMPWIGIGYALRVVQGTHDAELLLGLISMADLFHDIGLKGAEEEAWQRVLDLAEQGTARMIPEARRLPGFSQISIEALGKIVEAIEDDEWSDEIETLLPYFQRDLLRSPATGQGLYLHWDTMHRPPRRSLCIDTSVMPDVVKLGSLTVAFTSLSMKQVSQKGRMKTIFGPSEGAVPTKHYAVLNMNGKIDMGTEFEYGKPPMYKFLLKNKITKLHKQCLALVSFYAVRLGVAPEEASLEDVWRYFRERGCPTLAEILRKCICLSFMHVVKEQLDFFRTFSYDELESIISEDMLLFCQKEVHVLKVVIDWSMHKSRLAGRMKVGDVVRLIPAYEDEQEEMKGECVIKKLEGTLVEIVRKPQNYPNSDREGKEASSVEVECDELYDVAQTCFVRLLEHVRVGVIPINHFGELLSIEELCYACDVDTFMGIFNNAMEVKVGRQTIDTLGKHGKPRHGQAAIDVDSAHGIIQIEDCINEAIRNASTRIKELIKENDAKSEHIAELVGECDEMSETLQQVEQLVAQRIDSMTLEQLEALAACKCSEVSVEGAGSSNVGTVPQTGQTSADRATGGASQENTSAKIPGVSCETNAGNQV